MRLPRAFASASKLPVPSPALAPFAVTVSGPGWKILPRTAMEKQEKTNWCWAAAGQCIERHYQTSNPTQCQVAQRFLGVSCCSASVNCNTNQALADLLLKFGHLNAPIEGVLSFSDVADEIKASERPLCCFIRRPPNNHFVAIVGIRDTDGKEQLAIADPAVGGAPEEFDYASFRAKFKNGKWEGTFRTD